MAFSHRIFATVDLALEFAGAVAGGGNRPIGIAADGNATLNSAAR